MHLPSSADACGNSSVFLPREENNVKHLYGNPLLAACVLTTGL